MTMLAALSRWIDPVRPTWRAVLIGGLSATLGYAVLRMIGTEWWSQAIVVALILLAWSLTADRPDRRFVLVCVTLGVVAALIVGTADLVSDRITRPPFWDYTLFWIMGRVAASGASVYEGTLALDLGRVAGAPESFFREYDAIYPPPFHALVALMAGLDLAAASVPWYLVQVNALIVAIVAGWRILLAREGVPGLLLVALVVLTCPALDSTFSVGQTNVLLLACAMVLFLTTDRLAPGIAIAIATCIKPYFLVQLLLPILRLQWRVLLGAVLAGLVLAVFTTVVLGTRIWVDAVTEGIPNLSGYPFTQSTNQSLLAAIVRLIGEGPEELILVALVLVVSVVVFLAQLIATAEAAADRVPKAMATALLLVGTLVLYPATLDHYYLVLVAPLLYMWSLGDATAIDQRVLAVIIGAAYALFGAADGDIALLGGILCAATLVWMIYGQLGRRPEITPRVRNLADQGRAWQRNRNETAT